MAQAVSDSSGSDRFQPTMEFDDKCVICLDEAHTFNNVVALHPGGNKLHWTCQKCALQVLMPRQPRCPTCREDIVGPYGIYQKGGNDDGKKYTLLKTCESLRALKKSIPLKFHPPRPRPRAPTPAPEPAFDPGFFDDYNTNVYLSDYTRSIGLDFGRPRRDRSELSTRSSLDVFTTGVIDFLKGVAFGGACGVLNGFKIIYEFAKVGLSCVVSFYLINGLAFIPVLYNCLLLFNAVYHFILAYNSARDLQNKLYTDNDVKDFLYRFTLGFINLHNADYRPFSCTDAGKLTGEFFAKISLFNLMIPSICFEFFMLYLWTHTFNSLLPSRQVYY